MLILRYNTMQSEHEFKTCQSTLNVGDTTYNYFSLPALNDPRVAKLPFSIRVLLECTVRNCDGFAFTKEDVEKVLDWEVTSTEGNIIP